VCAHLLEEDVLQRVARRLGALHDILEPLRHALVDVGCVPAGAAGRQDAANVCSVILLLVQLKAHWANVSATAMCATFFSNVLA